MSQQDSDRYQKILSFCRKELIWLAFGMNIMLLIMAITLSNTNMLLLVFMNMGLLLASKQMNAWAKKKEEDKDE